jgi:hypothetical protein
MPTLITDPRLADVAKLNQLERSVAIDQPADVALPKLRVPQQRLRIT